MAKRRKTKSPRKSPVARRTSAAKTARRVVRRTKAKHFLTELEPILLASAGAVIGSVVAKKLPVAKSPNGEKIKNAAIALGAAYLSTKSKKAGTKSVLAGVAIGGTLNVVRSFAPALLSGDDLLGYVQPLGSIDEARMYAGLNALEDLSGDDLLGDDLLGDDLLGDDLLGEDLLGDDLLGDDLYGDASPYSTNAINL